MEKVHPRGGKRTLEITFEKMIVELGKLKEFSPIQQSNNYDYFWQKI